MRTYRDIIGPAVGLRKWSVMQHTQGIREVRRGVIGSAATAAVLATALAGCASSGANAGPSSSVPGGPSPSTGTAGDGAGASKSSPSAVLASWLTNLIEGRYSAVCDESVWVQMPSGAASPSWLPTSSQTYPSSAPSVADCSDITKPIIEGQSLQSALSRERAAFGLESAVAGKVSVHVATIHPSGDSVRIDARRVTVGGQRLDKIVESHTTGVDASQFDLTFPIERLGGSWYVGEFDMQLGTTQSQPSTTQPG